MAMNDNAYTGPRDPIHCQANIVRGEENTRLGKTLVEVFAEEARREKARRKRKKARRIGDSP